MKATQVHPIALLCTALAFAISLFAVRNVLAVVLLYVWALLALGWAGALLKHIQFAGYVTLPILAALLLVWAWAIDPIQLPVPHTTGAEFAVFCWLRIVAIGGMLQAIFVPLVEQPAELRVFLEHSGLNRTSRTLVVSAITFVPEIQRRINRIIDARRSQGLTLSGVKGLRQLPHLIMPLIASLLDSATKRAEFWAHRGVLDRQTGTGPLKSYNCRLTACVCFGTLLICIVAIRA